MLIKNTSLFALIHLYLTLIIEANLDYEQPGFSYDGGPRTTVDYSNYEGLDFNSNMYDGLVEAPIGRYPIESNFEIERPPLPLDDNMLFDENFKPNTEIMNEISFTDSSVKKQTENNLAEISDVKIIEEQIQATATPDISLYKKMTETFTTTSPEIDEILPETKLYTTEDPKIYQITIRATTKEMKKLSFLTTTKTTITTSKTTTTTTTTTTLPTTTTEEIASTTTELLTTTNNNVSETLTKNDQNNVTHVTKDIESYAVMLEENESNRTSDNILRQSEYDIILKEDDALNTDIIASPLDEHSRPNENSKTNCITPIHLNLYYRFDSRVLVYNVGGTHFSIYGSTIRKAFENMNSCEIHKFQMDTYGKEIFIDRDPQTFRYIINYLRVKSRNETFRLPNDKSVLLDLYDEADYFKLNDLKEQITQFPHSNILNTTQTSQLIELLGFNKFEQWELIYRATSHGFRSKDFHSRCDGVRNVLIIIQTSESYVFGGYAEVAFDKSNSFKRDSKAFIYSFINKANRPIKFYGKHENVIYCRYDLGPTFGEFEFDFKILDNSNLHEGSFTRLGVWYKYQFKESYKYEWDTFLAGSKNFRVREIEIYKKN